MSIPTINKEKLLAEIRDEVKICSKCPLSRERKLTVFGEGNPDAVVMFIGEAPGEDEDSTGRPFIGKAGQLLTKILASVKISREEVYIANTIKCRPPGNRVPHEEEMGMCFPYLEAQIAIINPTLIVTLGGVSTNFLLESKLPISQIRGRLIEWRGGKKIFPMFHPSFLLRHQSPKPGMPRYQTWMDVKEVRKMIDLFQANS
ncbi:MAG TPA: uracil-DNA glycosylase [Atribacteraceae bacterium]|nr:uracil-DNA glycosylase [Atribacteraceae bacterium]